ncbi:MAG TPA: hypothetical protein VKB58_12905 [Terriglobales bacterium]|nr:hypothetical protein [Terriglobales bacterium]
MRAIFAVLWLAALSLPALAQLSAEDHAPNLYDPVADPRSEVVSGHARFTVLTPQLIRMEWSDEGKFEDHASLVFLNRKLPVPKFTVETNGPTLALSTSALTLRYAPAEGMDGSFTADDLSVTFTLNGKQITWRPGMPDTGNLQGTTRTLDQPSIIATNSSAPKPLSPTSPRRFNESESGTNRLR